MSSFLLSPVIFPQGVINQTTIFLGTLILRLWDNGKRRASHRWQENI